MRTSTIKELFVAIGLAGLLLAFGIACGGGGGGGKSVSMASGTGFKGPVIGGDITVYGLSDNTLDEMTELSTTVTDGNGQYIASLAGFEGNVLVQLENGTYIDEATGDTKDNTSLRALVPDTSESVSAMVTPFTEIAYRLWEALLETPGELTISQTNAIVANVAGVANILGTDPVLVTDAEKSADALKSEVEYGLAASMLSQYANDLYSGDMDAAIQSIVDDLLDDMQVNTTGDNLIASLEIFLGSGQNESGIGSTGETFIDDTIAFIKENSYDPGADADGLTKAKELVSDLRDTTLLVYNYTGAGTPGLIDPFYQKVADEIIANFPYELSERLYILISAAMMVDIDALLTGVPQVVVVDDVTVTFTYAEPAEDQITLTFLMEKPAPLVEPTETIGEGTITYNGITEIPEDPLDILINLLFIEGAIAGDFIFGTTVIDVNIDFELALTNVLQQIFTLTLNGDITVTTGVATSEVSALPAEELQLLNSEGTTVITFIIEDTDGSITPTQLTSEGTITLGTTAEIEGSLAMTFVPNEALAAETISVLPDSLVVNGSITELNSDTPVTLSGTLNAGLDNADTFDPNAEWSELNYAQWNAVFNGTVSRAVSGSVTVLLDGEQSAWDTITFDASYQRTKNDKTVFLQGGGTYTFPEEETVPIKTIVWDWDLGAFEAEFANQTGTVLYLSSELAITTLELEGPVIGYIETAGGETTGTITLRIKGPYVTYIDGYGEYIFPLVE